MQRDFIRSGICSMARGSHASGLCILYRPATDYRRSPPRSHPSQTPSLQDFVAGATKFCRDAIRTGGSHSRRAGAGAGGRRLQINGKVGAKSAGFSSIQRVTASGVNHSPRSISSGANAPRRRRPSPLSPRTSPGTRRSSTPCAGSGGPTRAALEGDGLQTRDSAPATHLLLRTSYFVLRASCFLLPELSHHPLVLRQHDVPPVVSPDVLAPVAAERGP